MNEARINQQALNNINRIKRVIDVCYKKSLSSLQYHTLIEIETLVSLLEKHIKQELKPDITDKEFIAIVVKLNLLLDIDFIAIENEKSLVKEVKKDRSN